MIALNPTLNVLVYACDDDAAWFLLARPRAIWTDAWEPLRGESLPGEPLPAAALRIAREHGLDSVERVLDVHRGRWDHTFAVRVEAPGAVTLDAERHDDARWMPFQTASSLLDESDKKALRKLNRILDVFLHRIDVVVEETRDEGGCTGGCCSTGGGCGSHDDHDHEGEAESCGAKTCGASPFIDGRALTGEKVPAWKVEGKSLG